LRQARAGAVIEDVTVFAQHQAVARLADRQLLEAVGVDAVQEFTGIRPLDVDLAQGRDVDHADLLTHMPRLAVHGLMERLTASRIVAWPHPGAGLDHHRALRLMPFMHRCATYRPEVPAHIAPREGAQGDGRV